MFSFLLWNLLRLLLFLLLLLMHTCLAESLRAVPFPGRFDSPPAGRLVNPPGRLSAANRGRDPIIKHDVAEALIAVRGRRQRTDSVNEQPSHSDEEFLISLTALLYSKATYLLHRMTGNGVDDVCEPYQAYSVRPAGRPPN